MVPASTAHNPAHGKTDARIKTDVLAELHSEPLVRETDIGVLVKDGVVTLNGRTETYAEKWHAITATKRVAGVTAISDQIELHLTQDGVRTDAEVAAAAVRKLEWSTTIPKGATTMTVRDGLITLEGEVEWMYQRNAAENVIAYLLGVKGIRNLITIRPVLPPLNMQSGIRSALDHNGLLNANRVRIEAHGGKVTLAGTVASNTERDEAERMAWTAPGVLSVDNLIKIDWSWRSIV